MDNDEDVLLDELYAISGDDDRTPTADQYFLVSNSLRHSNEDIRERAIFIGGLRWMDEIMIGYFKGFLISGFEESDENRKLMVQCLVSQAMFRNKDKERLMEILRDIMNFYPSHSLTAKAAYVGIKRLDGSMGVREFASMNYDDVEVEFVKTAKNDTVDKQ